MLADFQNDTFGSQLVKNMNILARFYEFMVTFAAVNGKGIYSPHVPLYFFSNYYGDKHY